MKPAHYPPEPAHLWEHFYRITQIPRPSRQEAAVRQYIIDLAERDGHIWRMDPTGNLVVTIDASAGMAARPVVIIQNHLDMVTVKTGDKDHDFSRQPSACGWRTAGCRRTAPPGGRQRPGLRRGAGADDRPRRAAPAARTAFTVDEETGLGGALGLDPALLSGRLMLNLDTEDWHELYVGCAGAGGWQLRRSYQATGVSAGASSGSCH